MQTYSAIDTLLGAVFPQLSRCVRQAHFVSCTKLAPYMARFREMLVDLIYTPHIVLVVFLVFRVNGV
jgi:hypothetical protein